MAALTTTITSTTFEGRPSGKKSFAVCYSAARDGGDAIEIINSEDYGDGVAHTHAEV